MSFPSSIVWVGMIAASIGLIVLSLASLSSAYLMLKARNRYKDKVIIDYVDLGFICYGSSIKLLCDFVLVLGQISTLTAYLIYLGTQGQLVACHFGFCSSENKTTLCAFICTILITPACLLKDYK